jgi:hypothetical protein
MYKPKKDNFENFTPIPNPWEEREKNRAEAVSQYVSSFMSRSMLYSQAKSEGWDIALMRYVRAVASTQAQILYPGNSGTGYDAQVIFDKRPTKEQVYRFLSDQRLQANMGFIDVGIPTGMVEAWKADAAYRLNQINNKAL